MSTYGSIDRSGVVRVNGSMNTSAVVGHLPEKEGKSVPVFQNGTNKTMVDTETRSSGTTLVFKDVCVTIDQNQILKDVSGVARSGEILAILGPSGAGKSTLLNVLTGRLVATSGRVTLDGQLVTKNSRRKLAYVHQRDVFYPELTLKETLKFTAMLRLPESVTREQKCQRIQEVVDLLELNKCLGTKLGGTFEPGLSGGERKRATIACELLTNPKIVLLDEPTSGLDSAIAASLMSVLTDFAGRLQKTIVMTIHQPSSQIFRQFSKVLLMTDGQMAYYGPRSKIVDHFAEIGLTCDVQYNPADFILEQLKADEVIVKKIFASALALRDREDWPAELKGNDAEPIHGRRRGRVDDLQKYQKRKSKLSGNLSLPRATSASTLIEDAEKGGLLDECPDSNPESDADEATVEVGAPSTTGPKWPTGFVTQYSTLTRRAFLLSKDRFLSPFLFGQTLCLALIVCLEWFQIQRTEDRAKDKLGLMFYLILQQSFYFMSKSVFLIFDDYGVFLRERSSGIYRLSAYYLSITTAELPVTFVMSSMYLILVYWMAGMMPEVQHFLAFWAIVFLAMLLAQGLGFFFGTAITDRTKLTTMSVTTMVVFGLTGGYYNTHVPDWFQWSRYTSFISYTLSALSDIEFTHGYPMRCSPANKTSFPEYCINGTTFPGEAFVESANVHICSFYVAVLVLLGITISLRTVTYVILRFFRRPKI